DPQTIFFNGLMVVLGSACVGLALAILYSLFIDKIHVLPKAIFPPDATFLALTISVGVVARIISDVPGAALQVNGKIAIDNLLLILNELLWIAGCAYFVLQQRFLAGVGFSFF